jgi:chaperonin GroEL
MRAMRIADEIRGDAELFISVVSHTLDTQEIRPALCKRVSKYNYMKDNLYIESSREKLIDGITKAADVVSKTIGTSGSNVLVECMERPGHFATNDGATILGAMKFADPIEEMGRQIVFEAVSRANKASGDGSSTTAVLTAKIIQEGMNLVKDTPPMEIKRELEACIPFIESSLKDQRREITIDEVATVATVSAEDESVGKMIQEIYQKIGAKGIINWDISKTPDDSYTINKGIAIADASYATSYMCDVGMSEARLSDVPVLLVKDKITSALEFEALFKEMFNAGHRQLAMFCEEIDVPVISDLLQTQRIRGFRTVVIKMPVLWRDEWWEDLQVASGARLVSKASGNSLPKATMSSLGAFEHVTVKREETVIEGMQDMSKHILALQVDGSDEALVRAARLNTMTARYFVGAHSETALAYRRLKVEDAINAASCALENGVVVGGGVALLNASEELPNEILKYALKAPFRAILDNADCEIESEVGGSMGFNSRTKKVEDLVKAGIVDPYDVVLGAVKSAIGVAASVLTTQAIILLPKEENVVR